MLKAETGLLNAVGSKLREGLEDDLVAVVLFGSRARGEAHEGSVLEIGNAFEWFEHLISELEDMGYGCEQRYC